MINLYNVAEAMLPTDIGEFKIYAFKNEDDELKTNLALVKGEINEADIPIVRIHSECMTGDVFGSKRCDCGLQLNHALKLINETGKGMVIYLRQEGRGIGLYSKIKAYKLQENGMDTIDANLELGFESDSRKYDDAVNILKYFKINKISLITNNPNKITEIEKSGIEVKERIPSIMKTNKYDINYMMTKKNRMHHILE